MQFHHLFALLPLTLASATPLTTRTADEVYDGILGIDTAVRALTAQIEAYSGGIPESKPVFAASVDIHEVNRAAFAAAEASDRFSREDSQRIVEAVMDTVGESIPAGLELLQSKKDLFDEAELSSLVFATINLLKYDHETFSAATGAKLTLDNLPGGLVGAGGIEAALVKASAFYATPLTE